MNGIIFDADHTLYTPEADRAYERKFGYLAGKTGADPEELAAAWEHVVEDVENGSNDRMVYRKTLIGKMLEEVGVEPDDELVDRAYELFWETVVEDMTWDENLPDMLRRLKQDFEVLAIATDEFPEALRMKLSTVFGDPGELFADIVTPQDVGVMKPSPEFYQGIIDRHDLEPEQTVMVGDSWERDLQPAKELGMTTVMVDADTSDEPLEPDGDGNGTPDYRIDDIMELEDLLEDIR